MAKYEFLMLAHTFDDTKHSILDMFASEKVDGVRAFWDGGISRGLECSAVPYANIEKHARYLSPPKATGLWTRYAQPIQAPSWFLDQLPRILLDGELTAGRKTFQIVSSVTRKIVPDNGWQSIKYKIFDSPCLEAVFLDRTVKNRNLDKIFKSCTDWAKQRINHLGLDERAFPDQMDFESALSFLVRHIRGDNKVVQILNQIRLSTDHSVAKEILDRELKDIVEGRGEGVMLRRPDSIWYPQRSYNLLKVKPTLKGQAIIIGYIWGKETDVDKAIGVGTANRMLGYMGAIRCRLDSGKEFKISGFEMAERIMIASYVNFNLTRSAYDEAYAYGYRHPGEVVDSSKFYNPRFPIGSRIRFQYRELTDDGIPKEARYLRE
jgi:hypothetical protein